MNGLIMRKSKPPKSPWDSDFKWFFIENQSRVAFKDIVPFGHEKLG
jgi:hypothetical protein